MKKLGILLSMTVLYTLGILYLGGENPTVIHADERVSIEEVKEKEVQLKKKESDAERFSEPKKKSEQSKRTVNVEATAYTAFCEGCSGTTYTGIDLRANPNKKVIAVDPDIIPLGSKVRVPGYGIAVAGDIGGDIQGHRIDVFIPGQSDAMDFGRRQIEVEILS
ncbi:3D domain-containing protein [Halobacillus salinus]|uniref:3D domain-containing protein n=1 Tax=Halobacillus salinus TaxID=192814 RepID=UPI0009A5D13B